MFRQLRRVRRSLVPESVRTLVHAFVTSRVDYGNSFLSSAPKKVMDSKFRINRMIVGEVMTSYRFFNMAAIESEMYSRFKFSDGICLRRSKSIRVPNFDEISQSTAAI